MSWSDVGLLALAAVAVLAPGTAVLKLGLRRGWLETLAAAPAVSVTVCYLAGLLAGVTGLRWGAPVVTGVAVVLTGICFVVRWRWVKPPTAHERPAIAQVLLPAAALCVSVAVGVRTFVQGYGTLSVLPQEHDMVLHTLLVARIERSGEAAPWQSSPIDLLSGEPSGFYPNGMHMLAALASPGPADSVAALNAVTIVLFAFALPVGLAALARLLTPAAVRPVAMCVAPLVGVLAYRPVFALLHDGGVLANAAALALVPGVIYALLRGASGSRMAYATGALGMVGAVVVHPSAAPTIVITAGAWMLPGLVARIRSVRDAVRTLGWLAAAAVAALLVLLPFLSTASTTAGFVTSFPRGTPAASLGGALGTTLSFYYGGYFDPSGMLSQVALAVLSLLGVVLCIYRRSSAGLLTSYAVWMVILIIWLVKPDYPFVSTLSGIYYNVYGRFSVGLALVQWLTVAAALGHVADLVHRGLERVTANGTLARLRPQVVRAAPLTGAVVFLVFAAAVAPYAATNTLTLQQRYSMPEFERADADDLAAGRFLADRVQPGQRVMNNANDGSTYAYVFSGIPLVNTSTLGSPYAPYTTELLQDFDEMTRDQDVRALVCDMDIAWAMVDQLAPVVGAPPEVTPLGTNGAFSTARGLDHMDRVPVAEEVFVSGHVLVYSIDLARLGCEDTAG